MATTTDTKTKDTPEVQEKPEIAALGVELGVDNQLAFTSPFMPVNVGVRKKPDEELQEVLREDGEDMGPSVRQLVVMRRMDGQARALYRLLVLPLRAALTNSEFVAAEDGDEEAEYIKNVFELAPSQGGMTVTFHRFMSHLLQALFDGFAAFEKVFWVPSTGPLAGKVTLKKLAYRPSDTITFVADKQGGFAGLRQRASVNGRTIDVYIDPEYAFYYAAQEEERKFYGVSFFQSAFYHYDKKIKLYFTAHLAAQRAAVGTRVGKVPLNAGPAAKREFQAAMANLAFAQAIMLPEGFEVDVMSETSSFDFLAMVNHHNNQMSKSVLAGFFDKETGAGKSEGSLVNFAQPGDDMFVLMLRTIMDEIANQINHYIIPQLVDYNFKGGKYPKFTWGKLTDEQKAAISQTFDKLANQETVTPEFIRALEVHQAEEFGIDVDYEAVEAREAEQAALEQAMALGQQIDPATGLPMDPVALGAVAVPEGAEEDVESLDDVVALLVAKAEAEQGVAQTGAAPGAPGAAGSGATPKIQPRQPAVPAGAARQPAQALGAAPAGKPKKRPRPSGGGTIGLTDEMIDFADLVISGKGLRDG